MIARPNSDEVRKYLKQWAEEGYEREDAALRLLFDTFPKNDNIDEVLLKVSTLDRLFTTHVSSRNVIEMAKQIVGINDLDQRLDEPDHNVVEAIADRKATGKRQYSFATKYCAFHRPKLYPMYDSYVVNVLSTLLKQGETFDDLVLARGDIWNNDYDVFRRSFFKFQRHYKLDEFSVREIDKYLWLVGKEQPAST